MEILVNVDENWKKWHIYIVKKSCFRVIFVFFMKNVEKTSSEHSIYYGWGRHIFFEFYTVNFRRHCPFKHEGSFYV